MDGATRRRGWKVCILLVVMLVLASCGSSSDGDGDASGSDDQGSGPRSGGTLTVNMVGQGWPSLDPVGEGASVLGQQAIFSAIYDSLFEVAADGELRPRLATDYEVSDDGLTVTLTLRPDVEFQDGTPFDAEAVRFNILRFQEESPSAGVIEVIESVDAPDSQTVVLHLSKPYSSIGAVLATIPTYIASPTAVEAEGDAFGEAPVGAGPFKVVSNIPSSSLLLERFDDYWNAPLPNLDEIEFIRTTSETAALDSLRSGDAQLAYGFISPIALNDASREGSLEVIETPAVQFWWIKLNRAAPPFDNEEARRVLFYATDPEPIAEQAFFGYYEPTQVLEGSGQVPYVGSTLPDFPSYDPERAREMVEDLGGLSVTLKTFTNTVPFTLTAEALERQWRDVGIDVQLEFLDQTAGSTASSSGNFEAMVQSYGVYIDPALSLEDQARCGARLNPGYCSEEVDALLDEIQATSDIEEKTDLLLQVYDLLIQDGLGVPLFTGPLYPKIASGSLEGIPESAFLYLDKAEFSG